MNETLMSALIGIVVSAGLFALGVWAYLRLKREKQGYPFEAQIEAALLPIIYDAIHAVHEMTIARLTEIVEGQTPEWEVVPGLTGGYSSFTSWYAAYTSNFAYDMLTGIVYATTDDGLFASANFWSDTPSFSLVNGSETGIIKIIPSQIVTGLITGVTLGGKFLWSTGGATWNTKDLQALYGSGVATPNFELVQGEVTDGLIAYVHMENYGHPANHHLVKLTEDFETVGAPIGMDGSWDAVASLEVPAYLSATEANTDGAQMRYCAPFNNPHQGQDIHFKYTLDGGETWEREDHTVHYDDESTEKLYVSGPNAITAWALGADHLQVAAHNRAVICTSVNHALDWTARWNAGGQYINGVKGFLYNGLWLAAYGTMGLRISNDGFATAPDDYTGDLGTKAGTSLIRCLLIDQSTMQF